MPRPQIIERLERDTLRPLTLISAPAGYGKSTIAAQWLESSSIPAVWLSLDEGDNDVRTFLTYFVAAVRRHAPQGCRDTNDLLGAVELPPPSVLANALVNDLESLHEPFILALDDYHCIEDPQIQDHLLEQVLSVHSPALQACLLNTSILDRFCAPLCDVLCAPAGGGESDAPGLGGERFLRSLCDANLFTVSLSADGEWVRYHHFLQQLLQNQLRSHRSPEEIAELHLRASKWFESEGLIGEALPHALAAQDPVHAAEMVERHRQAEMDHDCWYVVERWLDRLPLDLRQQRPGLLLAEAWVAFEHFHVPRIAGITDQFAALVDVKTTRRTWISEYYFLRGVVDYFTGQGETSLDHLERAHALLPAEKKYIHDDAMTEVLDLLRAYADEHNDPAYLPIVDSCRARLALLRGELDWAIQWACSFDAMPAAVELAMWLEVPVLTQARVLIADGSVTHLARAAELLRVVRQQAEACHYVPQVIEAKVLQSLLLEKQDRPEEALDLLSQSVALAEPGGWIRPFVEIGPTMARMLARLPDERRETRFVTQLRSAFGAADQRLTPEGGAHPINRPLIEALTNREQDVLLLLSQRLYDKQIAERLNVSASTVRTHLRHLYEKLGVQNRRQAVLKAKASGIL